MIWFFDRDGERLRYEVRRGSGEAYELGVTFPDGRTETQKTSDPADLLDRCARLAQALKKEGWREA
jgi:hypothetical protein